MRDEQRLEDLRNRLQREKDIKNATLKLRGIQKSEHGIAACDFSLEESDQRISYFQNEVDKLQLKIYESSPKVARTHIPITLPSFNNGPPSVSGPNSTHTAYSSDARTLTPSRKPSSSSSHYPDDFISQRPLSTVGKEAVMRYQRVRSNKHPCTLTNTLLYSD